MTVVITLSNVGSDVTGPFDLFSDVDNFISAFESDVNLSDLINGYTTNTIPENTNVIRVFDKTSVCISSIDTPLTIEP